MTPERLTQIKALAKQWAEIASDEDAAPTGSMLKVINELIAAYEGNREYNEPGEYEEAMRIMKKPINRGEHKGHAHEVKAGERK